MVEYNFQFYKISEKTPNSYRKLCLVKRKKNEPCVCRYDDYDPNNPCWENARVDYDKFDVNKDDEWAFLPFDF